MHFVISLIQEGVIEYLFLGSWKLSKAHFPIFRYIVPSFLVLSSESFALNKVENGYFMQKIQEINVDK